VAKETRRLDIELSRGCSVSNRPVPQQSGTVQCPDIICVCWSHLFFHRGINVRPVLGDPSTSSSFNPVWHGGSKDDRTPLLNCSARRVFPVPVAVALVFGPSPLRETYLPRASAQVRLSVPQSISIGPSTSFATRAAATCLLTTKPVHRAWRNSDCVPHGAAARSLPSSFLQLLWSGGAAVRHVVAIS